MGSLRSRPRIILATLFASFLVVVAVIISKLDNEPRARLADTPLSDATVPDEKYLGYNVSDICVETHSVQRDQFFSEILSACGLSGRDIHELVESTKEIFDPRNLRTGRKYEVIYDAESGKPDALRYDISSTDYLLYDLHAKCAERCERESSIRIAGHSGVITSSLWVAMVEGGIPPDLIDKMQDVYAWSLDFYHLQKGDRFKLIYEEIYVDGEYSTSGDILAAEFITSGKTFPAYYYVTDEYAGYFDDEARPMKKAFLKAPVKYSRISSRYNPRRFHPVLKRRKAHLGTDYAAPTGTPIYAVANGVITKASFTRGNGNYVKIKHDGQISTQYLHMRNIKSDIKPGVQVKQGDVIGYVGQTGLASGPHVCFRFWKNGKQVDHLRENLPPPKPMPEDEIPFFEQIRDIMQEQLQQISYDLSVPA